jgi:hypothetical protein
MRKTLFESIPDISGLKPIIHFFFFLAVHEECTFGSSYLSYDQKAKLTKAMGLNLDKYVAVFPSHI